MNDDSVIKIMQSLGLDYNPAINSTLQFQKTLMDSNKQMAEFKANAIRSAKDINNAFTSQLGQMGGNKGIVDQYGNAFKTAQAEAIKMKSTLKDNMEIVKQSTLEQIKSQAASIQQRVATKGLSQEYGKQAVSLRDQLSVIQARLQAEGKLTAEEVKQTQQLKEQLDILRAQTKTAVADDIRENPSTFGQEWERRSSWFLTGAMFYGTINAAKEAKETIEDVEMGMVELARVMDDTSFVFKDYRDELFQLGVDYGQTFENIQQIALRWAQSGYNVADSLELTKTSLLALNTAELDAKNATESMIGIMAQWQLQAEDMALVMDKVNITADNYSITSQDLVDGLLRSSSAARNMNMTLDETISLLTVMREASGRSGREVGNALNSILSYITRGKSIENLQGLGIQMFTDSTETQFRNAMDIFQDIASKWDSLSMDIQDGFVQSADDAGLFNEELANAVGIQEEWNDVQKRDASQSAAGTHRRNYFIGMIERMSNTQGVLNNMMDAGGYSMRENADTMETLEKKQESLKASAEQLAVAIGDAGLEGALKGLADGGTGALNAINNLPPGMKDLVLATTTTFVAVKTLELGMKTFGIQIPGVSQMIGSLTSGAWSLTTALKAGGAGMTAFVAANGPLLALSVAAGAIIAGANAWKKWKEEEEKAIEVFNQYKETHKDLNELISVYEGLAGTSHLATDEQEKLAEVKQKIIDLLPKSKEFIDNENLSLAEQIDIVKDLNEQELERLRIAASKVLSKGSSAYEKEKKDLEELIKHQEYLNELTAELGKKYVTGTITQDELALLDESAKLMEKNREKIDSTTDSINAYESALEFMKNSLIENTNAVTNNSDGVGDLGDAYRLTQEQLGALTKSFEDASSKIQTYKSILTELNSKEGLSAKSKQDIITKHQELLPYLGDEAELRKHLIEIIAKEEEVQRDAYVGMVMNSKEFYNTKIKLNKQLIDDLEKYYQVDLENAKSLAEAKEKVEDALIRNLSGKWAEYYGAIIQGNERQLESIEGAAERGSQGAIEVLKAVNQYKGVGERFKNIALDYSGVGFKDINSSGKKGSETKKEQSQFLNSIDAEIRAIKIRNDNLERTSDLLSQQLNLTKSIEGIEGLNEQHRITGRIIENNQSLVQSYKNEQDELHKKANDIREANKKHNIDSWFDTNAEQTVDYINQYNKATKEQQVEMDKVFQQMQKIKRAWLESNQEARNLVNTTNDLERELGNIVVKQEEMTRNRVKELIEAEKRNAYMDLEYRQHLANEQLKAARQNMEKEVSDYQSKIDKIQDEIDRIQEDERLRQERLEHSRILEEISQLEDRYYTLQHKHLSDLTEEQAELLGLEREREAYLKRQEDIEKERIKRQEYENELLELRNKLDNIRNQRTIKQYKELEDGTWDFVHVVDQDAIDNVEKQIKDTEEKIADSNKRIEDLEKQHSKELKDLQKQTLKDLQKSREDYDEWEYQNDLRRQIEAKQRRIKEYQDEIKDLQDKHAEKEELTKEAFATEKENLDRYYMDIDKLTNEAMTTLHETFGEHWVEIYGTLTGFFGDIAREYDSLVDKLSTPLPTPDYSSSDQGFYTPPSVNFGGSRDYGQGASTGQTAIDNEERLKSDPVFRQSEIERTKNVINNRKDTGMSTTDQEKYLDRLIKGSYRHGGKITDTGTFLANFHGKENEPEWILNDMQFKESLKSVASLTARNIGLYIPDLLKQIKNTQNLIANINIPNLNKQPVSQPAIAYNQSGRPVQTIHNHIGKLVFPNVHDAREIENAILNLPRITIQNK